MFLGVLLFSRKIEACKVLNRAEFITDYLGLKVGDISQLFGRRRAEEFLATPDI